MKLDAWLKQDRSLEEQLLVIERLCQAVNEIHDRGDVLEALEPGRIEVGADDQCNVSGAAKGSPRPPYAPPEGGGVATAPADVYAAGAISWEILAGRPVGRPPSHLAEVRPDLSRELADAVMACLEQSPDWRPNDLTYLAQMAAARQRAAGSHIAPSARRPRPTRGVPKPPPRRGPSRRTWPLLAALVVVLGLAAVAARQYLGGMSAPSSRAASKPTSAPPPPPTPAPTPSQLGTSPNAGAGGQETIAPPAAPAADTPSTPTPPPPTPVPQDEPPVEPAVVAPVEDAPEPLSPPARPPAPRESEDTPSAADTPRPPTLVTPVTAPESAPVPAAPEVEAPDIAEALEPAVLTAVSPLSVKRPGKVLVDLRGTGLQPQHRARVLPVKEVPRGITVVGQKHVNDTLITILLQLDDTVEPGEYALAVEDGRGGRSEPLTFTVTK